MSDLKSHMDVITEELRNSTQTDSIDRVRARMRLAFEMFYDDEPSEPDQAIRDCLTDLMHISADREIDFEEAIKRASRMWLEEREDWGLDDE